MEEYRVVKKEIVVFVVESNFVKITIRRNGGEEGCTQRTNRISSSIFPPPPFHADFLHLSYLVVQFVKLDSKFLKQISFFSKLSYSKNEKKESITRKKRRNSE
jgi:hypothetical protein